jgi:lipopolysaccharide export system protein LptC
MAREAPTMTMGSSTAGRTERLPRGKARAHSRFVRVLRIALPMLMVGVISALAGLVVSHALRRQAAAHQDSNAPIRMTNPHFFGRDNQGRAFTLGAHEAARDEKSNQVVLLQFPSLILGVGSPSPRTLTADSGVYHEDTRMLLLRGNVRGNDANAARVATNEALVNTRTGTVTGDKALATQTAQGAVKSNSFDVYDKGNRVIFKGGVHARLNAR